MSQKWFEWFMIATACFALGASMCSCTTDDDLDSYSACYDSNYQQGGYGAVLECQYGKSALDIMIDESIDWADRVSAANYLNIHTSQINKLTRIYEQGGPDSGQCINGPCTVQVFPDPVGQPNAVLDENGYWHLEYIGAKYFQAKVKFSLAKLGNAARPDIVTTYTTDKWYLARNGFSFWSSRYNPLGSEYTENFRTAIADTVVSVSIPPSEITELINASGQYYRDCIDPSCGIGPQPRSFSSVNHTTKAQFLYMPEMAVVHDTITAFFTTHFYNENFEEEVVETKAKFIL